MPNFAVIENNLVINVIIADSKEIAESLTNKECIEYPDERPLAIGYSWNEEIQAYIGEKPWPSWIIDPVYKVWISPTEKPNDNKVYGWDEENLRWQELPGILG